MEFDGVAARLRAVERDLDLFEWNAAGVHVRERVRFAVHRRLLEAVGLHERARDEPPLSPGDRALAVYEEGSLALAARAVRYDRDRVG